MKLTKGFIYYPDMTLKNIKKAIIAFMMAPIKVIFPVFEQKIENWGK